MTWVRGSLTLLAGLALAAQGRAQIFPIIGGYHAGVCRTAAVGAPPPHAERIWANLTACKYLLLDAIKPGASSRAIYELYLAKVGELEMRAEKDPQKQAELAGLGPDVLGNDPVLVPLGGERCDAIGSELARHVLDGELVVGEALETRAQLAAEAFSTVAAYHAEIAAYLNQISGNTFPRRLAIVLAGVGVTANGPFTVALQPETVMGVGVPVT